MIEKMKINKAPGPSEMTSELSKAPGLDGIDWLDIILNDFMKQQDCHMSNKGDIIRLKAL